MKGNVEEGRGVNKIKERRKEDMGIRETINILVEAHFGFSLLNRAVHYLRECEIN